MGDGSENRVRDRLPSCRSRNFTSTGSKVLTDPAIGLRTYGGAETYWLVWPPLDRVMGPWSYGGSEID
jgi:hypothetical protein